MCLLCTGYIWKLIRVWAGEDKQLVFVGAEGKERGHLQRERDSYPIFPIDHGTGADTQQPRIDARRYAEQFL
jgi:hypothetical protein